MTTQTGLPLTPARRAALAIGVPLALALIAWNGLNIVTDIGTGSYQVHYPIAVTAGTVDAHLNDASVTLRPGGPAASLDGTVTYGLVRPHVTVSTGPDGTSVDERCVIPTGPGCGLDATLTVPRDANVVLSSGGGDLHVTGDGVSVSRLTVRSATGDITVRLASVPRDLEVSDTAGDIHIVLPRNSATYRVDAVSASGNVNDGGIPRSQSSPDTITATSGSGDITISELPHPYNRYFLKCRASPPQLLPLGVSSGANRPRRRFSWLFRACRGWSGFCVF